MKLRTGGKSRLGLLLIAAVFLLAAAGGYLAYTRFWGGRVEAENAPGKKAQSYLYGVSEITTNLTDSDLHFVQVKVELEVDSTATVRELETMGVQVQDIIIGILRNKTFGDINGESGMRRAGIEIIDKVNELLGRDAVSNIYFVKFIVQ